MNGGKWTNTVLLLCLIGLSVFQIFNGQSLHSKNQRRRSIRPNEQEEIKKFENFENSNNFEIHDETGNNF